MTTKWHDTRAGKRFLAAHGHKKRVRMTWLARARILAGLTVGDAARLCGLSRRSWEGWELVGRGHHAPGLMESLVLARLAWPEPITAEQLSASPYVVVTPQTLEVRKW